MSTSETESARRRAEAEINDCPIEQVRLTVPITDDPTIPVLTLRAWVLGLVFGLIEASTTGIGLYRQTPIYIPVVVWQLAVLPIGRFLARVLPTRKFKFPGTNKRFTLNPGPFSLKEHILISIMIDCGFIAPQMTQYMTILKIYYGLKVRTGVAVILNTSTQMLGFGLAGAFSTLLIDNPYMWWPSTLINVVVYRTLHKPEKRRKGSVTRLQYFCIASLAVFVYGMIPGFLFPAGACISLLCLIWKNSVWAHQIGSGRFGYGIGAFTISLETINFGQLDPFIMPLFSINNLMFGFILYAYVIVPIYYFNNFNYARRLPLSSLAVFDMYGKPYDEKRVMKADFTFDPDKYKNYSKLYFSTFRAVGYGFTFASLSAGLLHVLLHHGREMYHAVLEVYGYNMKKDVHGRLMQKYKTVPGSWYVILVVTTLIGNFVTSHIGVNDFMRIPPTYVILSVLLIIVLTVPDMILLASTGQGLPTGIVTEMVIGYLNRGKTFQNMLIRSFFSEVPSHIIQFCSTLKFGYYMKIPPREMFIGQSHFSPP
uniref:Oligopeptide transporter n=1 Tax=Kalanchoe fedtschenkoi TaxID=63787 RepID=A0A7N0U998_KALFE